MLLSQGLISHLLTQKYFTTIDEDDFKKSTKKTIYIIYY